MRFHVLEKPYGSSALHYEARELTSPANLWYAGWERWTSSHFIKNHLFLNETMSNGYLFLYTTKGTGHIELNGETVSVKPGDAIVVEKSDVTVKDVVEWEFMYVVLNGEIAKKSWDCYIIEQGMRTYLPLHSPLITLLYEINQEVYAKKINDPYIASSRAYQFSMTLRRESQESLVQELPESLQSAVRCIHKQLSSPLSVDMLAQVAGLSKYYFIQQFQRHLNETPMQYVTNQRMKRAMKWLSVSDMSIGEIAKRSGYESSNYFSKVFKRVSGESPSSFREKHKDVV
ncbi:transcriptional regulator [Fictibacillus macauensis ZFHKF-1]|uniref:Transcriptional regulator n=1 Tax=Fictibacillus macauensis ZFHKF-1 TaxID=1196324 RepID=I8AGM2_9BACL|nr:AraC family transcriptional regulator [Fictibacillus macauensis]EIT84827.1 transcriptional regulator [Fictibacillus macauensis ZFHKF-1]